MYWLLSAWSRLEKSHRKKLLRTSNQEFKDSSFFAKQILFCLLSYDFLFMETLIRIPNIGHYGDQSSSGFSAHTVTMGLPAMQGH
jgi:hypothetical protein